MSDHACIQVQVLSTATPRRVDPVCMFVCLCYGVLC